VCSFSRTSTASYAASRAISFVMSLISLSPQINDGNRSFFLNQLDGFDSNDGILVIGTTNHLERIDKALSSRPSRFAPSPSWHIPR
jgi:transitional endoplasmic reticulum ATPase